MSYDALLFDFDGVIVETPTAESMQTALRRTCDRFKRSMPDEESVDAFFDGDLEAITDWCREFDIKPDRFCAHAGVEMVRTQWEAIERGQRSLYEDVTAIRSLEQPLGIVSDNHPTLISLVLGRFDIGSWFETVHGCPLTRDGLERRKPNPDNLESALDALDAETAVYVGDRPVDVNAAEKAGIDPVLLVRGSADGAECAETAADGKLSSLRQLPSVLDS